jgi:heme-degrading monooxygenase HmoA
MVYRVDKFVVPEPARAEFLSNVHKTHGLLQDQPGFVQDLILEKTSGEGTFNIVTVVAWDNTDAIAGARAAVRQTHERSGFDPQD